MSLCRPHWKAAVFVNPPIEYLMYHVPFDGRHTATSVL